VYGLRQFGSTDATVLIRSHIARCDAMFVCHGVRAPDAFALLRDNDVPAGHGDNGWKMLGVHWCAVADAPGSNPVIQQITSEATNLRWCLLCGTDRPLSCVMSNQRCTPNRCYPSGLSGVVVLPPQHDAQHGRHMVMTDQSLRPNGDCRKVGRSRRLIAAVVVSHRRVGQAGWPAGLTARHMLPAQISCSLLAPFRG
jgi:hypothetical protein